MQQYWVSDGSDGWLVEANTPAEALDIAVMEAAEWFNPRVGDWSVSVKFEVWPANESERDPGYPLAKRVHIYDPFEPACIDDDGIEDDRIEHEWGHVGSWGHGAGVIVEEKCSRCGATCTTDTWRDDGHGGRFEAIRFTRE